MTENAGYECTGVIEVDGHLYHCNNNKAHGQMTMPVRAGTILQLLFYLAGAAARRGGDLRACHAGGVWGGRPRLAEGYYGASGNLPAAEELKNSGQLASVSFGQGRLLATPVQLAACFNTFANDGVYIGPTLVRGKVETATGRVVEEAPRAGDHAGAAPADQRQAAADAARGGGRGHAGKAGARPRGRGGQDRTAQTGRTDSDGNELLDSWFAGYYPAEAPRYTIVILKDSTHEAGETLAPVFARLCDALTLSQNSGESPD